MEQNLKSIYKLYTLSVLLSNVQFDYKNLSNLKTKASLFQIHNSNPNAFLAQGIFYVSVKKELFCSVFQHSHQCILL